VSCPEADRHVEKGHAWTTKEHERAVKAFGHALGMITAGPEIKHQGSVLTRESQPADTLLLASGGTLKGCAGDEVVSVYLPGDLLDVQSLGTRRHAERVHCVTPARLHWVPIPDLERLSRRSPAFQGHLNRAVGRELLACQRWLRVYGGRTVRERIIAFLLDISERMKRLGNSSSHFLMPLRRREMASYLMTAPETYSREMGRLEADGLLVADGLEIRLRSPEHLRRMMPWANSPPRT